MAMPAATAATKSATSDPAIRVERLRIGVPPPRRVEPAATTGKVIDQHRPGIVTDRWR
jgi:hypothetical protein